MAEGRSGQRDTPAGTDARRRRGRGFVTMTLSLPRFVITKPLANGRTGFYFNVSGRYRAASCPIAGEALGSDYAVACGSDGNGGPAIILR
jgi:hypothetical protein